MHAAPTDAQHQTSSAIAQYTRDRNRARIAITLALLLITHILVVWAALSRPDYGVLLQALPHRVYSYSPGYTGIMVFDTPSGVEAVIEGSAIWNTPGFLDSLAPSPGWSLIASASEAWSTNRFGLVTVPFAHHKRIFTCSPLNGTQFTADKLAEIHEAISIAWIAQFPGPRTPQQRNEITSNSSNWSINPPFLVHDLLFLAACITFLWAIPGTLRYQRARRAHNRSICVRCSYDLSATPTRCPECGHIPTPPHTT